MHPIYHFSEFFKSTNFGTKSTNFVFFSLRKSVLRHAVGSGSQGAGFCATCIASCIALLTARDTEPGEFQPARRPGFFPRVAPARPAAQVTVRRALSSSAQLSMSALAQHSQRSGTSRRPRLVGPCTDLARGDQSLPSTGGPCLDSAWFEAPPSHLRGPALILATPSPPS